MPRSRRAGSGLPGGESPAAARRQEWERLHGMAAPAALSPDFLQRDIAYRLQADQHGGLSADARRRLADLASGDPARSQEPRTPTPRIKPGSHAAAGMARQDLHRAGPGGGLRDGRAALCLPLGGRPPHHWRPLVRAKVLWHPSHFENRGRQSWPAAGGRCKRCVAGGAQASLRPVPACAAPSTPGNPLRRPSVVPVGRWHCW